MYSRAVLVELRRLWQTRAPSPFRRSIRSGQSTRTGTPSCSWSACWRIFRLLVGCPGWRCAISMPRAPNPDGEIGEAHDPETHLVPLVLAAARNGVPVRVFGDDYDTPDGTCVRDYVHVADIADAHVKALEHLLNGGESGALNLANARGFSVREVISAAQKVCGRAVPYETAARRP